MTFFTPKSFPLFAGLLTASSVFASSNNNFDLGFLDSDTLEALRVAHPGVSDEWLSRELSATLAGPVTTTPSAQRVDVAPPVMPTPSAQHTDPATLAGILALMVLQHLPTTTTATPSALPVMPALVPDDADFVPTTTTVVPSALPVMPALVPDDEDFVPATQALPLAPTAPLAPRASHSSRGYDLEVLASLRALHPGASDQWLMETYRTPAPRASVPPEYIESAPSLASLDQEMLASLLLVYPNADQAWLAQEVYRMAAATQPRASSPNNEAAQNGQGQGE